MISLFLAFALSPLLGTTLVLEEYVRYQNVVELMGEIAGSSALSTLANYDKHMDKRFGLMSISQKHSDLNALFNGYYKPNLNIIGKSATSRKAEVVGKFPLSNETVLRQQILENAELSVPAEFMFTGFDMGSWEKKLAKKMGMKDELDLVKAGNSMLSLSKQLVKFGKNIKKLYDENKKYKEAMASYKTAAGEFNAACTKLAALNAEQAALAANPDTAAAAAAMQPEIDAQKAVVTAKQAAYLPTIAPFKQEVDTVKKYVGDMMDSLAEIPEQIDKVREGMGGSGEAERGTSEAETDFTDKLYKHTKDMTGKYAGGEYKTEMSQDAQDLVAQEASLGSFTAESVGLSWSPGNLGAIQEYYTLEDIAKITSTQEFLNAQAELTQTSAKGFSEFLDILEKLQTIQVFYDGSYNSLVSSSDMYVDTSMALSSKLGVDSLNHMIRACKKLMKTVQQPVGILQFIKLAEAMVEFFIAFVEFIGSVFAWFLEMFGNLIQLASNPVSFYDDLLLFGYAGYNLPNRTNGYSGKTLYGYKYEELFYSAGGKANNAWGGTLDDFASGTIGSAAESKPLFKGAELEYMLAGGKNEIENQVAAFYDTYVFRLALDVIPILKNGEVKTMAAACGPLAWVPYVLIIIFEPLLDAFVLVNDGFEYFFKESIYLTPSGIKDFLKDCAEIVGLKEGKKNKGAEKNGKELEKVGKEADGKLQEIGASGGGGGGKKGFLKMKYAEHGIFLLMLRTNPSTYMNRLRNLIYMETKYKHKGQFAFDLDKSYTLITADMEYEMNPLFKLPSLTGGGPFTVKKTRDYYY